MIRLTQLVGQRVLTREGSQLVGAVHRVLLDPGRGMIIAAQLQAPVGGHSILDWAIVESVGRDGVVVSEARTREPEGEREQQLIDGRLELFGKSVLTEDGTALGEIEDIELDEVSGRVVRLHLPDQVLPLGRFVAVGPDVVIIAAPMASSAAASAG